MAQYSLNDLRLAKNDLSRRFLRITPQGRAVVSPQSAVSLDPAANVQGIGVGLKVVDGKATPALSVRLLVRLKVPRGELSPNFLLPPTYAGLPTDVEEVGLLYPHQDFIDPRARIRPIRPGCSTGFDTGNPYDSMAGTFGALVAGARAMYVLSANHVLADQNRLPLGTPIFEPGMLDGGDPYADQVAVLSDYMRLETNRVNMTDCALARLLRPNSATNVLLGIGAPAGTAEASVGMLVHKVGRTTTYTRGHISSVDTDVRINYDIGALVFGGQIAIESVERGAFSAPGDSGALVLEQTSGLAVGLLFSGSSTITFANHLNTVLDSLGVKLVVG